MNNLNRITLLSNTGRDVKTAITAAGKPVTHFSVATNKRHKDTRANGRLSLSGTK